MSISSKILSDKWFLGISAELLVFFIIFQIISCNCSVCEQAAENRRQIRYTPKVEVVIPGRSNIVFDGTVIYTRGSQAEINLALRNAFRAPVTVQGKRDVDYKFCLTGSIFCAQH